MGNTTQIELFVMAGSFALAFFVMYLPIVFLRPLNPHHFLKWFAFIIPLLLVASAYHSSIDAIPYMDVLLMEVLATGGRGIVVGWSLLLAALALLLVSLARVFFMSLNGTYSGTHHE